MAATIKIEINSSSGGKGIDDATRGIKELDSTARSAGGGVSSFGQVAIGALREVGAIATQAMAAAGTAIAGFVKDSIGAAGSFEAGMNTFAAASGAGGAELEAFKDQFIQLGKELPVSTKEVQDAATAMVKGGIEPAVVAGGALKDTLQFAAASAMGLEEAANLTAKTMATFVSQTASAAEKSAFMATSQELLVKAANASTVDVAQLGDAMLMAGGSAKAAGVSYQDIVTTMGMISGSFPSAATAGTSFNNFLTRMIPQTNGAKDAMAALGLYTEETGSAFYDANGQFVGMAQASQLLQDAFGTLTPAQRSEAMATIFGNDAKGAAIALMDAGAAGYDKFAASMEAANGIQGQSAATQQGFNFAMQNLNGSIEALQITIGSKLLPILTPLITQFTGVANAVIEVASAIFDAGVGSTEMIESLSLVDAALGLTDGTLAGVYGAFMQLVSGVQAIIGLFQANLPTILAVAQEVFTAIGAIIQDRMNTVQAVIAAVLPIILGFWQENGASIMATVQTAFTTIVQIISDVSAIINQLMLIIAGFMQRHGEQIVSYLTTAWNLISGIITTALGLIGGIVHAALLLLQGDFSGAWDTIKQTSADFVTNLLGVFQSLGTLLIASIDLTIAAIKDIFGKMATDAVQLGSNIIAGIVSGVTSAAGSLANAAAEAANAALQAAKDALGIKSPSAVFAAQVGMPIAQGMAMGMQQGAPLVGGSAQSLAGNALSGAVNTVTNNFNYSPNYSSTPNKPSADFSMMQALARAGT